MNRRIIIVTMCLGLAACQTSPPKVVATPVAKHEISKPENERTGEHLIAAAALVSAETDCMNIKKTPVADFTEQELNPDSVLAGEKFTHHLIYTVCDSDPENVIEGTLYRKIYRGSQLLHSEPKPFVLKPGRWAVNALIEVPAKSKPGSYTLKTEFIGKASRKHKIKLTKQTEFEVHS